MLIGIQDEILRLAQLGLLKSLLKDQTTGRKIRWATDAYTELGRFYERNAEITTDLITGEHSGVIRNRARKALELQSDRTKSHAEVFTPLWVCKKMLDEITPTTNDIIPPKTKPSQSKQSRLTKFEQQFIKSRYLEITCGEAPFLVQRYDTITGEILPMDKRDGILDRKLQLICKKNFKETTWLKWTFQAFKTTYGYELQGDNLLIARLNLYMTFEEYLEQTFHRKPKPKESQKVIDIITWNLWQMNGLTNHSPCEEVPPSTQKSLFDLMGLVHPNPPKPCQIRLYQDNQNKVISISELAEQGAQDMKFDYIVGNPPYQEEALGDNATFYPQIYDKFMNESFKIGNIVELIHPARFLFNAGSTPKNWNNRMLNNPHFKIIYYENNSSKIFPGQDIKGGLCISYHNNNESFGCIEIFTVHNHLNTLLEKIKKCEKFESFSTIVFTRTAYRLTDNLHNKYPNAKSQLSAGHAYDMSSNIFERLPYIFSDTPPQNKFDYLKIIGRQNNTRVSKYIPKEFVNNVSNCYKYKVITPGANGNGQLGEKLSSPFIGEPGVGTTETFISIGSFDERFECENCLKYIKTKFTRSLLSILKVTQALTPEKWKYVPLQDFTANSDIDWTQSIPEIDQQLYKKYGLSQDEIDFIETHVKAMD